MWGLSPPFVMKTDNPNSIMNRIGTSFALLCIIIVAACHKPQSSGSTKLTTSDTVLHVVNLMPLQVRFDLYKTQDDENNNTNLCYTCLVPAEGNFDIPLRLIDTSLTYYYDIYSADFTFTTWGFNTYDQVKFYQFGQSSFRIGDLNFSGVRASFLQGNHAFVTWKAVDYYEGYTSLWSGLTDNEKYKELVFYKSLKAFVYTKNSIGNIEKDSIQQMYLTSYYAPFYYIELQSGILDDYIYNTASPYANQANPTAVSKDTILLQEGYKSWVMVPQ